MASVAVIVAVGFLCCLPIFGWACSPAESTPSLRWSSSSNRLYIGEDAPGCVTLSEIHTWRKLKHPLVRQSRYTWLLKGEIFVRSGSRLDIHGASIGGDCNELRLLSTASRVVQVRADGGSISLNKTRVFSWDTNSDPPGPDVDLSPVAGEAPGSPGRSYMSAISYPYNGSANATGEGAEGEEHLEARLDIVDSEVAYLGSFSGEAYGLTWKVRGYDPEAENASNFFDSVNVYGEVVRSKIHHNAIGLYAYGIDAGNWSFNDISGNIGRAMELYHHSDSLVIHNNTIHDNNGGGIRFKNECKEVSIVGNDLEANNGPCVSLDGCISASVKWNTCVDQGGLTPGVELLSTCDAQVASNVIQGYSKGVSLVGASLGNVVYENIIRMSSLSAVAMRYKDIKEVQGEERPRNNAVFNNVVRKAGEGVTLHGSDNNYITMNIFSEVGGVSFSSGSRLNLFRYNSLSEQSWVNVSDVSCMSLQSPFGRRCTMAEVELLKRDNYIMLPDM